jgi:tetratricopeptide (TPR) repeat protein
MPSVDRPARKWSGFRPSRKICALAAVGLAIAILALTAAAQAPKGATPPLKLAERALVEGRYDEVDALADKADARDPRVVALKARAAIARGRYSDAEVALKPVAAKAPASDAALELGLLQHMLGRPDAAETLEKVAASAESADEAADLARAARALRAIGRFQEANAAYRDASAAAPNDPAINAAWGELFLEKYNRPEAVKSFQAAIEADPKYPPALLGMAEALADDNPPQALDVARRALAVNPSFVDAHLFVARQAVDAGHRDEARRSIQKALDVNPASLEAHALLAALAYVEDKTPDFEAEAAKALTISPAYGEVYRAAGDLAAHNYRFDEAVVLTRRALALQPNDPRALGDLGVHLLRTGDEPGARTALESSFKIDPYDVVTYNLLEMMDKLDKFATVRDGDVILRMDKDEAPVLKDYAIPLAHQALTTLSARYEFTPKGPILIEIFPKHDDFAVRNVGLPGMIGALGACFGRVVTMDSPSLSKPPRTFQWEATLWHELAHVITLQMSNQRVPRWLTEGISVYEEKRARPEWARPMDVEFAMLLERGETLKLRDLNAAFTDPRKISLAYYQASLLVEHLVTAYGDPGLHKLVRSYGLGLDTDAALKTALNTDFDQLQAGFDQSMDRTFGALRRVFTTADEDTLPGMPIEALRAYAAEHPRSYLAQMTLGHRLVKEGQADEAVQVFERAAALVPVARGSDSPHAQMAALALKKGDRMRAISELQALVAVDFDNIEAARQLASLLQQAGIDDPAKVGPVNQRIAAIDPFDADAHRSLGRLAMQANQADAAAREFRAVLALKPVDQAAAHTDLAESYLKGGKRAEAKKQTLAALEIAPTYERAQELLLKLTEGRP